MLATLFLLNYQCALYVEIVILIFKNLKQRGVLAPINPNLLELISEILSYRLLLKRLPLHYHVVLSFQDETTQYKVLPFKEIRSLQKL